MQIKRFHIKLAGFVLLLGLMFFLNNRIEKTSHNHKKSTESVLAVNVNHAGIAPLSAQIPHEPEGSLPIKLITNLNTNFLHFVNTGFEFKNEFMYLQLRQKFASFYPKIQRSKLISYLITSKSKDIQ